MLHNKICWNYFSFSINLVSDTKVSTSFFFDIEDFKYIATYRLYFLQYIIHPEIQNASLTVFKKLFVKKICPVHHSVYNICNPNGLKLLTRLLKTLSLFNKHRFNHNFENCINPLCFCSLEVESTSHFYLHCHYYDSIRCIMFNELCEFDVNLFYTEALSLQWYNVEVA